MGFYGYQDVFCGCGREFLSCVQFVFALPAFVFSAWRPLAVRCDEAVHLAVQKAQGQHNTIPLRVRQFDRGANRFGPPD